MKPKPKVVVIKVAAQQRDPNSTAALDVYQEIKERILKNHEAHDDGIYAVPQKTGTE